MSSAGNGRHYSTEGGGMDQTLDLYASPRHGSRKWIAIGLAVALIGAFLGYQWLTNVTPMTKGKALSIFRAERAQSSGAESSATRESGKHHVRAGANGSSAAVKDVSKKDRPQPRGAEAVAAESAPESAAQESASSPTTHARPAPRSDKTPLPAEGVYSWDTSGYEEVGGARRNFPAESQRIITHDGTGGWHSHHYFSEEREIWTDFVTGENGASIAMQRNKVTFGPVTNDSTIDFSPAMFVGPTAPEEGQTWDGSWTGDTYGDYTGKVFDHGTMTIGGESVEVWAVQVDIQMKGKQEGTVQAKVWLDLKDGLTVREDYIQNIKSGANPTYHAEWSMTLKSLHPRT
ncbi:MAG: hypothetical protein QOG54_1807 [Actinomycetota bacterium]|jgi:hypothetical protein|nr:hypothetical protein [Actinomycetota bacterium]